MIYKLLLVGMQWSLLFVFVLLFSVDGVSEKSVFWSEKSTFQGFGLVRE